MITKLFVYGTLAPGRTHEHMLKHLGGTWQEAIVCGTLYPEGWGAALGFPGINLEEDKKDKNKVEGLLFSSEKIIDFWPELDEFEGEGYERVLTDVELQNGQVVQAYIYALSGK